MLSVIVPVLNEADNIRPLLAELAEVTLANRIGEVIYVDDGSTDETFDVLCRAMSDHSFLRVVRHGGRLGQSAAFRSGARAASYEHLVFMDGDGQNDPHDIAALLDALDRARGSDRPVAVLGQRAERRDTAVRRLSSRVANSIRGRVLGDGTRDTGCSLKLIGRADYLALPYFDHMHRFLPALLIGSAVGIVHVDVSHRPRERGTSKYGFWNRALVGMVDLVGVSWLLRRRLPSDYAATEVMKRQNA